MNYRPIPRTPWRRVAALAVALTPMVALATVSAAHADESADTAAWFGRQLTDGLVVGDFGPDRGLSADVLVALTELAPDSPTTTALADALAADPQAYISGEAFDDLGSTYAGPAGKLAAALQLAGRSTTAAGVDLLARLRSTLATDGPEAGRAKDISDFGDSSNGVGQSWVVRAFALAGDDAVAPATDFLLRQQCGAAATGGGGFRLFYSSRGAYVDPATDCTADIDTTAFAVIALADAREAGVPDLDDDIADAVDFLAAAQNDDGSVGDQPGNTNTTGLSAVALAIGGDDDAALDAADFVRGLLVTPAVATGPLAAEGGAIAYTRGAFDDALTDGITASMRDQFIRASAQAALALAINPAAGSVPVTAPAGPLQAGATVSVSADGLAPREAVSVAFAPEVAPTAGRAASLALPAAVPVQVTANAAGSVTASLTAPQAGTYRLTVSGLGSGRSGAVTVTVIGPAPGTGAGTGSGSGAGTGGAASGAGSVGGASSSRTGSLPGTGAEVEPWMIGTGLALVAAGGVALATGVARRRGDQS